jgi:phage repressor protein C with HTH and peptisase S24 domain
MGIAEKLLTVIGERSVQSWALENGLSPQTVHEWIKHDRSLRGASMKALVAATRIQEDWWLHGEGAPPAPSDEVPLHRAEQERAEYVAIPLYNGVRAAAGAGAVIDTETPDDALMFRESWIRFELGARPKDLYLIRVAGDSMEPTLRSGDAILVDRRATRPDREGVYILRLNGMLLVKRLQALPGGVVRVTSDNTAFAPFEVTLAALEGPDLVLIGRVVWTGRRL